MKITRITKKEEGFLKEQSANRLTQTRRIAEPRTKTFMNGVKIMKRASVASENKRFVGCR